VTFAHGPHGVPPLERVEGGHGEYGVRAARDNGRPGVVLSTLSTLYPSAPLPGGGETRSEDVLREGTPQKRKQRSKGGLTPRRHRSFS